MRILPILIILILLPSLAFAAPACYTLAEMRAEEMLRLHSELMVITVTCHQASDGTDLVPAYESFTHVNLPTLHAAEQTMITYYKHHGAGQGVDQLDKLRTRLGNEFGQEIADVSAPAFCAKNRDLVPEFAAAPPQKLEDEAARLQSLGKSDVPLCAKPPHIANHG
jgi:hypothetical protein